MIFIDRSIPSGVADALKCVRDDIRWLEDEFDHRAKEHEWMPDVAARGWPAILRDKKIRTRPLERRLVFQHNLGCFVLTQKTNPTRWEYLKLLVKSLDELETRFEDTPRPCIYLIDREGNFRLDERFSRMAANGWLA